MELVEKLAEAVLERDSLRARSLVQDLVRSHVNLAAYPAPSPALHRRVRTMAAALLELLAERHGVSPPVWVHDGERFPEPTYVTEMALKLPRHAERCRRESPAPLAKRNIYAPADFLTYA